MSKELIKDGMCKFKFIMMLQIGFGTFALSVCPLYYMTYSGLNYNHWHLCLCFSFFILFWLTLEALEYNSLHYFTVSERSRMMKNMLLISLTNVVNYVGGSLVRGLMVPKQTMDLMFCGDGVLWFLWLVYIWFFMSKSYTLKKKFLIKYDSAYGYKSKKLKSWI